MFGKNSKKFKIRTNNGWEHFYGIQKLYNKTSIHIILEDNFQLKCTVNHKIDTNHGVIEAQNLIYYNDIKIKTINGLKSLIRLEEIENIDVYDIINSGKDHLYYSNGILSHNCEFLGSSNTLIEGSKIQQLIAKDILEEVHGMEIYEHPVKETFDPENGKQITKEHLYVICCDVSEGKNLDYSAFSVIDCSTIPYKQVAIYRNNIISPILLPDVIKMCAEYYNKAYVLVEVNNNPQVADCLYRDLEYENVFQISSGNKEKQKLSTSSKATQNGLNMSPLVKRTGCSTLKTLIETNKLEIYSSDTIYELSTFTLNKGTFKAEEGENDDLVMTLIIFAWLTTQQYFIEISSSDIRKQLQIENNYKKDDSISDEELPPSPFFGSDIGEGYFVEDGDAWMIVDTGDRYNYW